MHAIISRIILGEPVKFPRLSRLCGSFDLIILIFELFFSLKFFF